MRTNRGLFRRARRKGLTPSAPASSVSDPGRELISSAQEAGVGIHSVPGPAAVTTAVSCADPGRGLGFTFVGFLPEKRGARISQLAELAARRETAVLYVPPHDLVRVLELAAETVGKDRPCAVCRELTKLYEEFWRGSLAEAAAEFAREGRARGEVTLLIAGAGDGRAPGAGVGREVREALRLMLDAGVSPSRAAKHLAAVAGGLGKNEVYAAALDVERERGAEEAGGGPLPARR